MPNLSEMKGLARVVRRSLGGGLTAAVALSLAVAASPARVGAEVQGFTGSWLERAVDLQYELGSDVGFRNAPLIGTHNSFNSQQEMGTGLTPAAANQTAGLVDQLDSGVRSLEIDLRRGPDGAGNDDRPVVCHPLPHAGCTVVTDLGPLLAEVRGWLERSENADQVIVLYLEDDLDDTALHDSAAATIDTELGERIYAPTDAGCQKIDSRLTRDDVRAAGKQVLVVSGCGSGAAWQGEVFSWDDHLEARPRGFEDSPSCGPDFSRHQYQSTLVRYYENAIGVPGTKGGDDGLTPETTSAMVRCGVDLFGFDRLEPLDGRLEATIWSWAPEQPSRGRCALIRAGRHQPAGRWRSVPCGAVRSRPVCRNRSSWSVGKRSLPARRARRYCRRHHSVAAVPRTGYEDQLLLQAMAKRKARTALLGMRRMGSTWVPLDPRG